MIQGAYVLISSVLTAAVYTILITVFNDRVMEIIYASLPVPVESAYNVNSSTQIISFALYAVPVIVLVAGFLYFIMRGPAREADTAAPGNYLGTGYRRI